MIYNIEQEEREMYHHYLENIELFDFPIKNCDESDDRTYGALLFKYNKDSEEKIKELVPEFYFFLNKNKLLGITIPKDGKELKIFNLFLQSKDITEVKGGILKSNIMPSNHLSLDERSKLQNHKVNEIRKDSSEKNKNEVVKEDEINSKKLLKCTLKKIGKTKTIMGMSIEIIKILIYQFFLSNFFFR